MKQDGAAPRIPPPLERQRGFALGLSLAMALLYAELGFFHSLARGGPDRMTAFAIVGAAFVLTYLVYLASFAVPPWLHRHPRGALPPQVLELLFRHWGVAAGLILSGTAVVLGLYLYLTSLDLVAAYNLLKDLALYAAAGCAFHGLLLYVRYATYLYQVHQEDRLKMIVATVSIGILLMVLTLYLLTLDITYLRMLEAARDPRQGLVGLHIYGRGLYLAGVALTAYAWHIRWIGDH